MRTKGGYRGQIAPHIVGLSRTEDWDNLFALDTQLGVIYWLELPGRVRGHPTREPTMDDAYDLGPEDEREPAWTIRDFYEILKDQFRQLCAVLLSPFIVTDMDTVRMGLEEARPLAQAIYREYAGPNFQLYRKEECLRTVEALLRERWLRPLLR
ncbi:hypothetical protein C8A03DRAFT_19561 [Achaetomium macrosporum]|uniref:Uncharacterized protein n=1 Tax=Achaetomium macrosporum TaxID=79813 RepID=A0AAN7C171_9PEZI|nr:hypothetical protein C8A03DRAFT_19561 [Achaetomium macrosporum]